MAEFNPQDYLVNLAKKGEPPRWYLEVKWRLMWLRTMRPEASVTAQIETTTEKGVVVRAEVSWPQLLDDGSAHLVRGTGYAYELWINQARRGGAIENAETSAIGRALAHLGYGTQFATELDEDVDGKPADAPVSAPGASQQHVPEQPPARAPQPPPPVTAQPVSGERDWLAEVEAQPDLQAITRLANEMVAAKVPASHPARQRVKARIAELQAQGQGAAL